MKSVGQILYSQRKAKKWSLDDVNKFIKIHPKYLKALESGDTQVFKDKIHALGFLRNYAEFLELDVATVLALWRREFGGEFDLASFVPIRNVRSTKFVFSSAQIFFVIVTSLIVGFFTYVFYQYKNYSDLPVFDIYSPANDLVTSKDVLDIQGRVDFGASVLVNNQNIPLSKNGIFATTVKLNPGLNVFSFTSYNREGKKAEVIKTVIYRPAASISLEESQTIKESSESSSNRLD